VTFDELCERLDELGVPGNAQLVIHEPGEGFWTLESVERPNNGEGVRLVVQQDTFFETEG
jgi:hypothetical protein